MLYFMIGTCILAAVIFCCIRARKQGGTAPDINRFRDFAPMLVLGGVWLLDKLGYSYNTPVERQIKKRLALQHPAYPNHRSTISAIMGGAVSFFLVTLGMGFFIFSVTGDTMSAIYIGSAGLLFLPVKLAAINKANQVRRMKIILEFPDFLSAFLILLEAGLSVQNAMRSIAAYEKEKSPLFEELSVLIRNIDSGKSEAGAYREFSQRCIVPDIGVFVSIVMQNLSKGSRDMPGVLRLLIAKARDNRKTIARQMGEEASSKLLFPQAIIFIAILGMIAYPAFMALSALS